MGKGNSNIVPKDLETAIQDFETCMKKVEDVARDKIKFSKKVNSTLERLNDEKAKLEKLKNSRNEFVDDKIEQALKLEIENKLKEVSARVEAQKRMLAEIEKQREDAANSLTVDDIRYNFAQDEKLLQELREFAEDIQEKFEEIYGKQTIESLNVRVDTYGEATLLSTEEAEKLRANMPKLRNDIYKYVKLKRVDIGKIFDWIFIPAKSNIFKVDSKDTTIMYAVWCLIVFAVIVVFLPVIIFVYLITLSVNLVYEYIKSKNLIKAYIPFRRALVTTLDMDTKLERLLADKLEQEREAVYASFAGTIKAIEDELLDLNVKKMTVEQNVRNNFDSSQLLESLETKYLKAVESLQDLVDKFLASYNKDRASLAEFDIQSKQLLEELKIYKKEIEVAAMDMTNMSRNPRLLSKFFLGFDNRSKPVYFNWKKKTSVVVYKEEDKEEVIAMIKMMMTQLFKSVNVFNLETFLFDVKNSGMDFAMFIPTSGKNADSLFSIVDNDDRRNAFFNRIEDARVTNTSTVLNRSDDIHTFNENMIDKGSLTKGYIVSIFLDYDPKIFSELVLQQILRNSYKFGILPIVFVPQELVELVMGDKVQYDKYYNPDYKELFENVTWDEIYTVNKSGIVQNQKETFIEDMLTAMDTYEENSKMRTANVGMKE